MRWRPLFEVRRYAKEFLIPSHGYHYLPPYRVMVFESRWKLKRLFSRVP